jgi:hypothetical protein
VFPIGIEKLDNISEATDLTLTVPDLTKTTIQDHVDMHPGPMANV